MKCVGQHFRQFRPLPRGGRWNHFYNIITARHNLLRLLILYAFSCGGGDCIIKWCTVDRYFNLMDRWRNPSVQSWKCHKKECRNYFTQCGLVVQWQLSFLGLNLQTFVSVLVRPFGYKYFCGQQIVSSVSSQSGGEHKKKKPPRNYVRFSTYQKSLAMWKHLDDVVISRRRILVWSLFLCCSAPLSCSFSAVWRRAMDVLSNRLCNSHSNSCREPL